MTRVFINYSTGDEENVAAMLDRHLSDRFDSSVFFRASKSIPYGDDFSEALLDAIHASDALLVVIGVRWLAADEKGQRKIDKEGDWTRREIEEAFASGVRVIPVLIGSVAPLREKDLPPVLAKLARCQYARLASRSVDKDLDLLGQRLMELVPGLSEKAQPGDGISIRVGGHLDAESFTAGDSIRSRNPAQITREPGRSNVNIDAGSARFGKFVGRNSIEELDGD
ncbi:toll/interleukin-1 receptor domain-containing protein [Nonomuraea sp. NPDC050022]|uniref:toll/interleukin-1 receptor domain-containing protein n=1 Tax=unclassified Nonomuraea TaxID=2593643 RepID=UPI0033CE7A5A